MHILGAWAQILQAICGEHVSRFSTTCTGLKADRCLATFVQTGIAYGVDVHLGGCRVAPLSRRSTQGYGDILVSESVLDHVMFRWENGEATTKQPAYTAGSAVYSWSMQHRQQWQGQQPLEGPSGPVEVWSGCIISGPLVNDPDVKRKLITAGTKAGHTVVGGEMESAGLAEAANQKKIPFIMMKGISDDADGGKGRYWQHLAAAAPARFLHSLLISHPSLVS